MLLMFLHPFIVWVFLKFDTTNIGNINVITKLPDFLFYLSLGVACFLLLSVTTKQSAP